MRVLRRLPFVLALAAFALPTTPAEGARISAGEAQSCGIGGPGAVVCWGARSGGSLGDGQTRTETSEPVPVLGLTSGATHVASTRSGGGASGTTCAIVKGAAKCWGRGPLGNGTTGSSARPVDVSGLASGVTDVSVSVSFACAIQNGAVKCWGSNILGHATLKTSPVPVQTAGLESGATSVAAGWRGACAVASGVAHCWGGGQHGSMGSPGGGSKAPRAVVGLPGPAIKVAAGTDSACAIVAGGAVYCWGTGASLGNGIGTSTAVPQQVVGLTAGVTDIAGNSGHYCAIQAGTALCWGANDNGQLGNGTSRNSSLVPVAVANISGVSSIATGGNHSCAIATGGAYCWGSNGRGQLGREGASSSVPVQVGEPIIGKTAIAAPVSGTVTVKCPGEPRKRLGVQTTFRLGCTVDATRGVVSLTSAMDARGTLQTAQFSLGSFVPTQIRERGRSITVLTLSGQRLSCSARASARRKAKVRRLFGNGKGTFRTKGYYGSATIRGTKWTTTDRCDGTLFRVTQGVITVRAFRLGRTVTVRAGRSFLAPARRPRRS